MAAKLIFPMQNNFGQGNEQGICTCSSLTWARKTLKAGRGLNSYAELGLDDHTMNAQMAVLRKLDNQPDKQCELVQLEMVGTDTTIASIDDVVRLVKAAPSNIAIFWTQTHTMGYRYAHHEKEFFDVEKGLYRAKYTKDIKATMTTIIGGYGPVLGLRVVKLPAS
jgi:hypothetical protein